MDQHNYDWTIHAQPLRSPLGTAHFPMTLDLHTLTESTTVECKLAIGRDGKGALPREFFPTYSAFANTHGGTVILGINESNRKFTIDGIAEPQKIITDLFNNLNNPQKVSINLLTEECVKIETIDGKQVIVITIPQASRKQRPVYLHGNPMNGNTYIRLHEGDRPCDDERVKRMMGEQVHDVCDQTICTGFTLDDLDSESIKVYRNLMPMNHTVLEMTWKSDDGVNGGANQGDAINGGLKLDELDQEIINNIKYKTSITQEELVEKTGKSLRTIQRRLANLTGVFLKRVGSKKTGNWELIPPGEQNGNLNN